jgi:hypothetical protein
MTEFGEWDSFYLIVGGAAGALIGLQFVVLTLIAALPHRPQAEAGHAFSTPTVLHFCVALLIAAVLRAPWHGVALPALCWGIVGLLGIIYAAILVKRVRAQHSYDPEAIDWLTYVILPSIAYVVLLVSALTAETSTRQALFGVAAASLLLLFIGIYNAWDTVTYHVFKPPVSGSPNPEEIDEEGQ